MRIRTLLAASAILFAAFTAKADTMYVYTGQNFSSALSPINTPDSLSGSFVIANPLAPNSFTYVNSTGSPAEAILPISWTFTDGVSTLDQTDSLMVSNFTTDSTGAITNWELTVLDPLSFFTTSIATPNDFYDVISVPGGQRLDDQGFLVCWSRSFGYSRTVDPGHVWYRRNWLPRCTQETKISQLSPNL